jgi:heat shock protein HtpX
VRGLFLENREEGLFGLFATHPPIEKRIAALQQYAGGRIVEPSAPPAPAPRASPAGPWDDKPPEGPWG